MSDQGQDKVTVIYLPAEIEWYCEGEVWTLNFESRSISRNGATIQFPDNAVPSAFAQLMIEMLAQLEALAAYTDDLETDLGDIELRVTARGSKTDSSGGETPTEQSQSDHDDS